MSRILWKMPRGRAHFRGTLAAVMRAALPKVWLSLLLEPRDFWIGVYWTRPDVAWAHALNVYVCAVPCLPLLVEVRIGTRRQVRRDLREAWWAWRDDERQWDDEPELVR